MEEENLRFGQTAKALNDIDEALKELQFALQNKKNDRHRLKEVAARSVARIDELINRLNALQENMTQEENGSGNNND